MADSCVKHRRSWSQGRRKSGSASPTSRTRPTSPSPSTHDEVSKALQFLDLPEGVVDIDDNEEGYGSEMFAYLREREELFVVEEDYLDQSSVSPEMRSVLVDWLLQVGEAIVVFDLLRSFPSQVQHYMKLSQETLYLCISLLDTILDKRDVEADKLQLVGSPIIDSFYRRYVRHLHLFSWNSTQVGITSLYVASKCEEYYPAELKKLVHLTENSYRERDVFDMELVLLGVVHFQVSLNLYHIFYANFSFRCMCPPLQTSFPDSVEPRSGPQRSS